MGTGFNMLSSFRTNRCLILRLLDICHQMSLIYTTTNFINKNPFGKADALRCYFICFCVNRSYAPINRYYHFCIWFDWICPLQRLINQDQPEPNQEKQRKKETPRLHVHFKWIKHTEHDEFNVCTVCGARKKEATTLSHSRRCEKYILTNQGSYSC